MSTKQDNYMVENFHHYSVTYFYNVKQCLIFNFNIHGIAHHTLSFEKEVEEEFVPHIMSSTTYRRK